VLAAVYAGHDTIVVRVGFKVGDLTGIFEGRVVVVVFVGDRVGI